MGCTVQPDIQRATWSKRRCVSIPPHEAHLAHEHIRTARHRAESHTKTRVEHPINWPWVRAKTLAKTAATAAGLRAASCHGRVTRSRNAQESPRQNPTRSCGGTTTPQKAPSTSREK